MATHAFQLSSRINVAEVGTSATAARRGEEGNGNKRGGGRGRRAAPRHTAAHIGTPAHPRKSLARSSSCSPACSLHFLLLFLTDGRQLGLDVEALERVLAGVARHGHARDGRHAPVAVAVVVRLVADPLGGLARARLAAGRRRRLARLEQHQRLLRDHGQLPAVELAHRQRQRDAELNQHHGGARQGRGGRRQARALRAKKAERQTDGTRARGRARSLAAHRPAARAPRADEMRERAKEMR